MNQSRHATLDDDTCLLQRCCLDQCYRAARRARRHPRMLAWRASQGQSSAMHNSDVLLTIVTLAARGGGFEASQAIRVIAGLVEQLEMSGESRAQDVDALISIGATLWTQHQKLLQCGCAWVAGAASDEESPSC